MTAIAAHEIVTTAFCKIAGCEDEVKSRRGRYAGLCESHQAAAIDAVRADLGEHGSRPRRPKTELGAAAAELQRQARRVDRASKKLDEARAELRSAYLQFGVAAGFLTPRGDR